MEPQKSFYSELNHATRILVFNSTKPLLRMSGASLLGSFMAAFFVLYGILVRIVKDHIVEGWTTIIFCILFIYAGVFHIDNFWRVSWAIVG